MTLSTKDLDSSSKVGTKREKIMELKKFHEDLFKKEGVSNPKFIPRLCYPHKGEKVISFYDKEIYGGMDIYVEFCSKNYLPEDPERKLWKWIYNAEYATEYEMSDPHPETGDRRYLIPVEELVDVREYYKEDEVVEVSTEEEKIKFPALSEDDIPDIPFDAMTVRDYAAIKWQKPVSTKDWLNQLIKTTFNV